MELYFALKCCYHLVTVFCATKISGRTKKCFRQIWGGHEVAECYGNLQAGEAEPPHSLMWILVFWHFNWFQRVPLLPIQIGSAMQPCLFFICQTDMGLELNEKSPSRDLLLFLSQFVWSSLLIYRFQAETVIEHRYTRLFVCKMWFRICFVCLWQTQPTQQGFPAKKLARFANPFLECGKTASFLHAEEIQCFFFFCQIIPILPWTTNFRRKRNRVSISLFLPHPFTTILSCRFRQHAQFHLSAGMSQF